jgi:hypothetical protein
VVVIDGLSVYRKSDYDPDNDNAYEKNIERFNIVFQKPKQPVGTYLQTFSGVFESQLSKVTLVFDCYLNAFISPPGHLI